ncbi:hypothetical protein DBR11_11325 [Pedobacter sp. HMWF019]|uniref:hypothetical protein n=1 Tax=Pedobacter sp. HMWF019 TaxID=2056856 RepID=UPI000D39F397|nr:hypothetical protein [Pedobacter sp. HMWF019]PTS99901.1 hypothetical protein DBR11_11325 [Pedobacter sp. HMWF019]
MKSKFTLFILLLAILASCKKTTNVDVTVSTSGKLSYKLLDGSGKGLPNVKVSLFDNLENYYYTSRILLDTRTTDQNGLADFGDLNPRNYLLIPDSPMVNNVKYSIQDYVQVTAGKTKIKEVKVTDCVGTFTFLIKSYFTSLPAKNIGILLIPANKSFYSSTATPYLNIADYKGITDDSGSASFKVPSNKEYVACIYNTTTNVYYNLINSMTVQTNAIFNMPVYISGQ